VTSSSLRKLAVVLFPLLLVYPANGAEGEHLDFGHLSDLHFVNLAGVDERLGKARSHFLGSSKAFPLFLQSHSGLNFVAVSGDVTDAISFAGSGGSMVSGQMDIALRLYKASPIPLYFALGNHDLQHYGIDSQTSKLISDQTIAGAARAAWIRNFECFKDGTYYSFERRVGTRRFVFLVLEHCYHGSDAAKRFRIGDEQLDWIRSTVEANSEAILIVTMHVPLKSNDPASGLLKDAFDQRKLPVIFLTGHLHDLDFVERVATRSNAPVFQVHTPSFGVNARNWRMLSMFEDRIEIHKSGDTPQIEHTVWFKAADLKGENK
jgi:hypothetical protein